MASTEFIPEVNQCTVQNVVALGRHKMRPSEKLQRVRCLIRQAQQNVEQQTAVLAALKLQGHNSDDAKNLLGAYTDEVDRHRADLDRLLEEPDVTPQAGDDDAQGLES